MPPNRGTQMQQTRMHPKRCLDPLVRMHSPTYYPKASLWDGTQQFGDLSSKAGGPLMGS